MSPTHRPFSAPEFRDVGLSVSARARRQWSDDLAGEARDQRATTRGETGGSQGFWRKVVPMTGQAETHRYSLLHSAMDELLEEHAP